MAGEKSETAVADAGYRDLTAPELKNVKQALAAIDLLLGKFGRTGERNIPVLKMINAAVSQIEAGKVLYDMKQGLFDIRHYAEQLFGDGDRLGHAPDQIHVWILAGMTRVRMTVGG